MEELRRIGLRVQQLRKTRTNMSQTDLAIAVGVSWPTISRLERGIGRRLDLDRLTAIAKALGVTLEDLLNGSKAAA